MSDERRARLVEPFYLGMMSANAIERGGDLLPAIAVAGSEASVSDVVALLHDPWRSTVMGAWLALLHEDERVTAAVLEALALSHGYLDSMPLATAAAVVAGSGAIPALQAYAVRDEAHGWGACSFVAAAIQYLGVNIRRYAIQTSVGGSSSLRCFS